MQDILRQAMAADGYPTRSIHQKTWSEIRKLSTNNEIKFIKKSLNINVLGVQEYQEELWVALKYHMRTSKLLK